MTRIIEAKWLGPFSWPSYEDQSGLPSLPDLTGLYLQTFEYKDGYLVYAAGLTRRKVITRFKEHTRNYKRGEYTVFDMDEINRGVRKEFYQGWTYARDNPEIFENDKDNILRAVDKQLASFRVFVAEISSEPRVLERLESGIMEQLYREPPPICDIPDKGMFLAAKKEGEEEITIKNISPTLLHGLPELLDI